MSESVSTIAGDESCKTCNQTFDWHRENKPVHPFNTGAAGAAAFLGPRDRNRPNGPQDGSEGASRRIGAQRPAFPIDPVLRQALVDKGILTPQDLKDAEEKINAVTGLFNQPGPVTRGGNGGEGQVQE